MVQYTYDAWGRHYLSGTKANTVGVKNPFRYRGYYYDTETGLYYLQTRYYDSETGRFLNMDSFAYADPETLGGLNLYSYCNNNPVMYVDPTGHIILSILLAAVIGAGVSTITSVAVQLMTNGKVDWAQVGISAAFGAVSGLLSFVGLGGVAGQFLIQGALGVGELYSIAALQGTASSIGPEQVVATFLFAGALGAIGSKNAASEFKRVGQIESDFIKYTIRDISVGKAIASTVFSRGTKYLNEFLKPYVKQTMLIGAITAVTNSIDYWMQKLYDYLC